MADEDTKGAGKGDKVEKLDKVAQPSAVEQAVARGVDEFVATHLRNSPFSRDTTAWNHFHEGKSALVGSIVKQLEG